jgi:hypothetical protein
VLHYGTTDTQVVMRHCSGELNVEFHKRAEGILQDRKFTLILAHHLHNGVLLTDEIVDHRAGADDGEAAVNFHHFGFALGKLDEIVDVGKLLLLEEVALLDPESDAVGVLLERLIELLDLPVKVEKGRVEVGNEGLGHFALLDELGEELGLFEERLRDARVLVFFIELLKLGLQVFDLFINVFLFGVKGTLHF